MRRRKGISFSINLVVSMIVGVVIVILVYMLLKRGDSALGSFFHNNLKFVNLFSKGKG